jgi:predicted RNase H-like HicB family nuclease
VKDYHINIFWSDEDGGYIADIPDLEACSAFGTTPAEALAEVQRAKAAWLEAARAEGRPVPAPRYRAVPRDQIWFHHPAIQGRIRKAEADVAAGRTKVTRTPVEAQALLDTFKARRPRSRG